jgi:ABC-type spermidine/putrescine transport system permease subunit II
MRTGRLLGSVVTLTYGFILLPLIVILGVSFNDTARLDFPPTGLSLRWYDTLIQNPNFMHALLRVTMPVGIVSALCATLLGTLAALGIVRHRFPGRDALQAVFLLPLVVPHILLGAALYLWFANLGFSASIFTLVLGHILIATPYVIRTIAAGLAGLDKSIEEAARDLGASRFGCFVHVVLPQLRSSLVSAGIFALIVSFSDINIALFVSGPETTTVPVFLFSQIQWDSDPSIAAASAGQIVLIGLTIFAIQTIFRARIGR